MVIAINALNTMVKNPECLSIEPGIKTSTRNKKGKVSEGRFFLWYFANDGLSVLVRENNDILSYLIEY